MLSNKNTARNQEGKEKGELSPKLYHVAMDSGHPENVRHCSKLRKKKREELKRKERGTRGLSNIHVSVEEISTEVWENQFQKARERDRIGGEN